MRNFIVLLLSLGMTQAVLAQNDLNYFKDGTQASSLVKCGLKIAIGKIKSRGLEGPIRLQGELNEHEMHLSFSRDNYESLNKVARSYVDFEGSIGAIPVKGSVVFYAQKKLDHLGRPVGGVLCKLGRYDQLRSKSQRRFILIDKKSGFEID